MSANKPSYEELLKRVNQLEQLLAEKSIEPRSGHFNMETAAVEREPGIERRNLLIAEKAYLESEELFSLFLKNSPIYAFIKEVSPTTSRVIKASENYSGMIGIPGTQMVGKTMEELFPADFAAKITADDWEVVANGQVLRLEEELNGRYYTTIKYPIIHAGKRLLAGYTIDITDLKEAEQEVIKKNGELLKLIAEKDKFFSIMAHDLRSPFNAFLGLTRIMVEDLPEMTLTEIQRIAISMSESANNLYQLLENLLEWSRLQRGIISFEPRVISLMSKMEESLSTIKEAANKKDIVIEVKVPPDLTVCIDEAMFGSVIRNLTSNAVKFTPKGGKIVISAQPQNWEFVEIWYWYTSTNS